VWEKVGTTEITLAEQVAQEEPLANREVSRLLETRKITSISFEDRPLQDVLDYLSRISGVNFVPTREAREAMEMDGLQVNLAEVQGLSMKNILQLVLENLGDSGYGYKVQNGAVVIGPLESLGRRMYLQFYPVEDIASSHPDFIAPPIAVNLQQEDGGVEDAILDLGMMDEGAGEGAGVSQEQLVELINQRILGDDMENGTAEYQSGKLVVRTTLENHRKIRELLESLRQLSGVLVTVESRFLDLQDNLLEEIGVSIGGPVESGLEYPIPDVNGLGTSVASGYAFIDQGLRYEVRAANITSYSGFLGTEVTPFNITPDGGIAIQYATLDDYQLEAILTAVSKTQESRSLDAPRVIAFDSQNAYTMVVDQIAYIKDVDVNQTGVSPVINPLVGSFRVGSILEIRPTVTYDRKYVILEVKPTTAQHVDSEFAQLSLAQGFTIVQVELPVIVMSQIRTTITVPDGGTVLVGGLEKVVQQEKSIGIPAINRIPLVNLLFGRRGETRLRNKLFILIKASIVIVKEQEKLNFP
jgi:general secretion pathway protein D